jgi:hypothetical protein
VRRVDRSALNGVGGPGVGKLDVSVHVGTRKPGFGSAVLRAHGERPIPMDTSDGPGVSVADEPTLSSGDLAVVTSGADHVTGTGLVAVTEHHLAVCVDRSGADEVLSGSTCER